MTGHFSHPDYDSLIFRKYNKYYPNRQNTSFVKIHNKSDIYFKP